MNPTLLLIQTILGSVPAALQLAQEIRNDLAPADQAALDAQIAGVQAAAQAAVAVAVTDLDNAAKIP
jgi:hypothetical protein